MRWRAAPPPSMPMCWSMGETMARLLNVNNYHYRRGGPRWSIWAMARCSRARAGR
jgi:hypothetical protein